MAIFDDDASKSWDEKIYTRDEIVAGKTIHYIGLCRHNDGVYFKDKLESRSMSGTIFHHPFSQAIAMQSV